MGNFHASDSKPVPIHSWEVFERSMEFMSGYMQSQEWWKLEPHPELISDNPSEYCSADPGENHLVYLPWGGKVKPDLSKAGNKVMYYDRIDLTSGNVAFSGKIMPENMKKDFGAPEDYPGTLKYKDWLLHVYSEDVKNYMKDGEWLDLFGPHGTSLWRSTDSDRFPDHGWEVDGDLVTTHHDKNGKGGGSIITRKKYADFDLRFEFKLTEGANSGVKYLVKIYPDGRVLGPEYQIIDDFGNEYIRNDKDGKRKTASLYALFEAHDKKLRPVGEWNTGRIYVKGDHVEHWLNGVKVLEYTRGGPAFEKAKSESKFRDVPDFGTVEEGYILLQDHGDNVSFRNVRIRVL